MIYIKKVQNQPPRITIGSDKSNHLIVLKTEDDIGALAEAFGFAWSPEELRDPIDGALETLSDALKDRIKIEDPGYFTALESGIRTPKF